VPEPFDELEVVELDEADVVELDEPALEALELDALPNGGQRRTSSPVPMQ